MAKRERVLITSKSNPTILSQKLIDIMKDSLLRDLRKVLVRNIDLEVSKIFKYISSQMGGESNFAVLKKYKPKPWKSYSDHYQKQKIRNAQHTRWFSLTGDLQDEFESVSEQSLLEKVGPSRVSISRDRSKVTASIAPKLRLQKNYLEDQLHSVGLLSDQAIHKLHNRADNYRSMVGPVFQYFLKDRIPKVIRKVIKGQK